MAQTSVFLNISAINPAALDLARNHDMMPVFETSKMFKKEVPAVPMGKVFGITSFKLV